MGRNGFTTFPVSNQRCTRRLSKSVQSESVIYRHAKSRQGQEPFKVRHQGLRHSSGLPDLSSRTDQPGSLDAANLRHSSGHGASFFREPYPRFDPSTRRGMRSQPLPSLYSRLCSWLDYCGKHHPAQRGHDETSEPANALFCRDDARSAIIFRVFKLWFQKLSVPK